jgi:glutaminyl-peptide cyclotransferase
MSKTVSWLPLVAFVIGGAIVLLLHLTGAPTREPTVPVTIEPAPVRKYDIVAEYPHDPNALTQGLIYAGGFLYESTGRQGQSTLRKVELKTGRVLQQRAIDDRLVGEGLTEWRGQLIQLTPMRTKSNSPIRYMIQSSDFMIAIFGRYLDVDNGVRYDLKSLEQTASFHFSGDGWGLTHDDRELIKSDGTSMLRFLSPDTMKWQGQIGVTDNGKGIRWLNELEFVNGEVYANIWQQDRIAVIQPDTGKVTGWIDLSEVRPRLVPPPKDVDELGAYGKAVANGIAYDKAGGHLFVTGKNWPRLFEIRLRN